MEWSCWKYWPRRFTWQPAASSTSGNTTSFYSFTLDTNIFHSFEPWNVSLYVCVRACVFSSVVGPAVTFRIRQNEHNMTAAEVAAKAGEAQKHTLTPTYARMKWSAVCGALLCHSHCFFPQMPFHQTHFFLTYNNKKFVVFSPQKMLRRTSWSLRQAWRLCRLVWERYLVHTHTDSVTHPLRKISFSNHSDQ